MVLAWILGATLLVSLVSFTGIFILSLKHRMVETVLFAMVAFAAGTLLGAAFLDLLPEASELIEPATVLQIALVGIVVFFLIEKIIHWHHYHYGSHWLREKPLAYLNLIGDGIHNFFDGAAIAASFLIAPELGITTTLVVLLHEIPQEVGDFSLLLYSGFSRAKALLFNFLSGLLAVIGALGFYYFSSAIENLEAIGLAFTGGMFIYIAAADLFPEFQKEKGMNKSLLQFFLLALGILMIGFIAIYLE
ncbi:MAG TPA: ZIP family metal transporter [Candidatus Bilamarchaeaceae archaeon]|nr:ZIP family metal transporter [Candidatus Bilamarchaeaceae archaeon]